MALTTTERGLLALEQQRWAAGRAALEEAGDDPRALLLLAQLAGDGLGEPADPARKRALHERAAALGSAQAAFNLGAVDAQEQRYADALAWYARAAELGEVGALRMLGIVHACGEGTAVDDAEAERLWLAAVERGSVPALHDLGVLYVHHRDDPVTGTRWLLRAAKAGVDAAVPELHAVAPRLRALADRDDRAATLLGVVTGFHLDDPRGAVALLTGPAQRGDPEAQRTLAFLLDGHPAVPAEPERAAALHRAAALAGDGYAALNLGVLTDDPREAVGWLRRAAEAGVTEAYAPLGDALSRLDLDAEALEWYVRGGADGQVNCMLVAGDRYRDGIGTPVDLVQAVRWYLRPLAYGDGDGVHRALEIGSRVSVDELHEAGRQAESLLYAEILISQCHGPAAADGLLEPEPSRRGRRGRRGFGRR